MNGEHERGDEALRAAFAELRHGEEAPAPPLERLLERQLRRRAGAGKSGVRWAAWRHAARVWGTAAAVALAAGMGLWLGTVGGGPPHARPRRQSVALSTWEAPTDFLLDTPGSELLRSMPAIPEPIPSTLTSVVERPTGDLR